MNKTYSFGRFYISIAPQAEGSPLIDRAFTVEHDGLKRRGKGYMIRLPFAGQRPTHGINIGWWKEQPCMTDDERARAVAVRIVGAIAGLFSNRRRRRHTDKRCGTCRWEIDPETCQCGLGRDGHTFEAGHTFVPLGCTCGYENAANMKCPDDEPKEARCDHPIQN